MGKKKYISLKKMWELFEAYKTDAKQFPRKENFISKKGRKVSLDREKPLTMVGFESYVANQNFISRLDDYFSNKDERYNLYAGICSRIRAEIKTDQIEGGMCGIYNPSITQRLNNLSDKIDQTVNQNVTISFKD